MNLFVYGTLKEGKSEKARLVGYEKGFVEKTLYSVIQEKKGSVVEGELYRGMSKCELIILDEYENIESGKSYSIYKREQVIVTTLKGKEKAWAYVAKEHYTLLSANKQIEFLQALVEDSRKNLKTTAKSLEAVWDMLKNVSIGLGSLKE